MPSCPNGDFPGPVEEVYKYQLKTNLKSQGAFFLPTSLLDMYLKSSYPEPPVLPEANVHHIFFNRPEQAEWPDYIVHIDVETEEQIMYRDFTMRIKDLATGLGAPLYQGGMGLQADSDEEIVGIIAENSSVSI